MTFKQDVLQSIKSPRYLLDRYRIEVHWKDVNRSFLALILLER